VATADSECTVTSWDLTDPARPVRRGTIPTQQGNGISSAAFSPDGRTLACVDRDYYEPKVTLSDVTDPAHPVALATIAEIRGLYGVAFSPDGRTLAIGANGVFHPRGGVDAGKLMLWSLAARAHPVLLATQPGFAGPLVFSPDGRTVASSDGSGATVVWDVTDRSHPVQLAGLNGHSTAVTTLGFSPDGRTIATGSADRIVILWDLTDRIRPRRLATLTGDGKVRSISFAADLRTLAIGTDDQAVTLWDIAARSTPVRLATLKGNGVQTGSVVFSPDRHTLALRGNSDLPNQKVTLWDYRELNELRADPVGYACATVGEGLHEHDWDLYVPEVPYQLTCRR
jgi:WD40 repeat protein